MRLLRTAAFAMLSLGALHASGQALTNITATQVYGGPTPITGRLCFTPVDKYGNNIAVTKYGGGYYAPGTPFCGTLTAGALTTTVAVPNSANDSAPGHGYSMSIYDTVNNRTYPPVIITGISGTTWSLDVYAPPTTVPTAAAFTYTTGSAAPTGVCTAPALYSQTNGALWVCVSGAWVQALGADTFPYLSNVSGVTQATCTYNSANLTACYASGISATEFSGWFRVDISGNSFDPDNPVATITLPTHGTLGDICQASLFDADSPTAVALYADAFTVPGTVTLWFAAETGGHIQVGDSGFLQYTCVRAVAP